MGLFAKENLLSNKNWRVFSVVEVIVFAFGLQLVQVRRDLNTPVGRLEQTTPSGFAGARLLKLNCLIRMTSLLVTLAVLLGN